MCGRTCLTLAPHDVQSACIYKSPTEDKYIKPEYRFEFNCGKKFEPSYNIAPTDVTPILISNSYFDDNETCDRILVPMMWGIIPFWHKGDYKKHGLTTNNCRLETMLTSKLYKSVFQKGQRCVILCEGFYEWQTTKGAKSSDREAYFFYMPQKDGVNIAHNNTWNADQIDLLKVAGLFDVWTDDNGDNIYSYSVITFESNDSFSWLHHRSPAILETEQQVSDWLNFKSVSDRDALTKLRPASTLVWHRVSNIVNNSRNKSDLCNKPIEETTTSKPKNDILNFWLKSQKHKDNLISKSEENEIKIEKCEN